MPMGDTNATPVPMNPSRFAMIKSWEAESPPSRTTLVVRYLRHDQLCHRHNGQYCSCWCWSRLLTLPGDNHLTPSLRISSSAGAKCSRSNSIRTLTSKSARYRRCVQIRQFSERKHPRNCGLQGNMQHFRGQDLESRLSGCWAEKTTAACQFHIINFQSMRI